MAKKVVRTDMSGTDMIVSYSDGSTETIAADGTISRGVVVTGKNSVVHTGNGDLNINSTVNYS